MQFWGAGEALGSGCAGGCPIWERGFLADTGAAAALAGRQGGHLCAPLNEGSLHSGGDAAGAATAAVPCAEARRKGPCSVPRVLGRILRKQQGRNKRHWLVGWPHCYSEPARISKAGVIHSAHHSNMVILEIQEGKSQPC